MERHRQKGVQAADGRPALKRIPRRDGEDIDGESYRMILSAP